MLRAICFATLLQPDVISKEEELALRAAVTGILETNSWPRFQFVDGLLRLHNVPDPRASLEAIPTARLSFPKPLEDDAEVRVHVEGFRLVRPEAPLLFRFTQVLRRCVDYYESVRPVSAAAFKPVIARARDLWSLWGAPLGTQEEMRRVGLLLEGEGVGKVRWTTDDSSPWNIELTSHIRSFSRVGCLADYEYSAASLYGLAA